MSIIRPKRIGIDLDQTLNRLGHKWIKWIQDTHDPEFTMEKWTSFAIHELLPCGDAVYDFLKLPGAFRDLGVEEDAQRVTERLHRAGHEIFVVTAYIPEAVMDKCGWLREFFPHIDKDHVIFCNKKHMVNVDVLIDDGLHNAHGFRGAFIVFDQPWNRDGSAMPRARGWKEVEAMLEIRGFFSWASPNPEPA